MVHVEMVKSLWMKSMIMNKMITTDNLIELGFKNKKSPFSDKYVWVLGEEDVDSDGIEFKNIPILYYDIEKQSCDISRGEYCRIIKKCDNILDITKFVDAINFLFDLSLVVNIK